MPTGSLLSRSSGKVGPWPAAGDARLLMIPNRVFHHSPSADPGAPLLFCVDLPSAGAYDSADGKGKTASSPRYKPPNIRSSADPLAHPTVGTPFLSTTQNLWRMIMK